MSDWAMYSALSGTDNWERKRQDRAQNLMLAEKMEQRAQKSMNDQMQMEAGMNEYLNQASQFDVMPEDQERINELEKRSRRDIIKGITKFNGDLKKYMASGGLTDLNGYKNSILKSEEVKNAAANKSTYADFVKAKQSNLYVGRAEVQVPVYDKKGNIQLKNGKPVTKSANLTMDKQMALFKKGIITKINIGNVEKKADVNPLTFKSVYKDDLRPWSKDNIVTEQDVYNVAIMSGSEEQARDIAKNYGKEFSEGKAWKFKAMNNLELQKLKSGIQVDKARVQKLTTVKSSKSKGSSKTRLLNTVNNQFDELKVGTMASDVLTPGAERGSTMWGEGFKNIMNKGTSAPIASKKLRDFWGDYFVNGAGKNKIAYDINFDNIAAKDKANNTNSLEEYPSFGRYDISTADSVVPLEYVRKKVNGKIKKFVKLEVSFQDERAGGLEDGIPESVRYATGDEDSDLDHLANNWVLSQKAYNTGNRDDKDLSSTDVRTGHVLVDVTDDLQLPNFVTQVNRASGITSAMDGAPQSTTRQNTIDDKNENMNALILLLQEEGFEGEALDQELYRLLNQ